MLRDFLKFPRDLFCAQAEFAINLLATNAFARIAPSANGPTPVLTIPGFSASEDSLSRLNNFLNQCGFAAQPWGLGRNMGLQNNDWNRHLEDIERRLADRIKALADSTSSPVCLVGHSLGGIYAREIAARMETEVDRVITLGSPTFHPYKVDRHNRFMNSLSHWINRYHTSEMGGPRGLVHWNPDSPRLPCVAIHSPIDGVTHEKACQIPDYIVAQSTSESPRENIRVLASHIGMTVSLPVFLAVADRLAADRNDWRAFQPQDYFPALLHSAVGRIYPRADHLGMASPLTTDPGWA